ncbi:MAG: serine/threonine protein kinase [Vulcanimicrobiota bacterium]
MIILSVCSSAIEIPGREWCGEKPYPHYKEPKSVRFRTDPDNVEIYIRKLTEYIHKGRSNEYIIIDCIHHNVDVFFIKSMKDLKSELDKSKNMRYKNNYQLISADYFDTHDTWPEKGRYILKEYGFFESLATHITQYRYQISAAIGGIALIALFTVPPILRRLRYHRLAIARATELNLIKKGDMTIAAGELGDLRGKSLKGQFHTYQVKELIGEGGMSMVYEGWREILLSSTDEDTQETYAIKIILPSVTKDPDFNNRFQREISVYLRLKHPSIVQIYDWGDDPQEKIFFMAMEKVSGKSLAQVLKERKVSLSEAVTWTLQTLDGLEFAHCHKVVHRDIKPNNLFVTTSNRIKILDFGIARKLDTIGITATDVVLGTPQYLPPEQVDAKAVDERADLYSVGITLYEMAAGALPFSGDSSIEMITKHVTQKPPAPSLMNPDITASIERVILRLIEKKPQNRYRTAREARDALLSAAQEAGIVLQYDKT